MPSLRTILVASTAAAATFAPALVSAADGPAPVVELTATVKPGHLPIPPGTPLALRLGMTFHSPPGSTFVLQHATLLFGPGARFNGKLFPSCSVARLKAAKGSLKACPKGSKVGSGIGVGTAVALGITSSGKMTVFNGPGGRSLTLNFSVVRPAMINATFSAPITRLRGKYAFKFVAPVPPELQTVLGGDIVVKQLTVTTGATLMIDGVKRGYFEAMKCPANGSIVHGDFTFNQGAKASAEATAIC
ncbi:MAG: hypothetical protein WBC33_08765 [Conexibacter sp.]